jgi:hypothetical protein
MEDHALSAITYFGSSIVCALLFAMVDSPGSRIEPRYAYVQVGPQKCVADTSSDVLVTIDVVPECVAQASEVPGPS